MIIIISSNKIGQSNNLAEINIDGEKINSESCVLLLGLEIDSKLNFDLHITISYAIKLQAS